MTLPTTARHEFARSLLLVLLAVMPLAAASPLFPPETVARIRKGLDQVYNLDHDAAIENYQAMIRDSPNDPAGYVYLAKVYWLQELMTKQELSIDRFAASDFFAETPRYQPQVSLAAEQRFFEMNQQAIEKARARLDQNPNDLAAQYLLGAAYQNEASFEASLKRSWWASFRAGSKTFRYHRALLRQDPSLYDAYLSIGVFDYVTGRLGWSVKWLAYMLGYRGSKERGKEEIHLAAQKGHIANDDARVVLTLIHTRERNFQAAFDELSILLKRFPRNYLVHLDMGGIALLMDRPEAAIVIYQDVFRKVMAGEPKYRDLGESGISNRLGVAYRYKRDFASATQWFARALKAQDRTNLSQVVSHLELGKSYDLMGRRNEAIAQYRSASQLEDFAGSQQEARDLISKPYGPKSN
jgi:tetratricopeptide (TPR) repeat protein